MRRGIFQCLGKQTAQNARGVQCQCQRASIGAEPGSQHHQHGPHQFRNGAQRIEQQATQAAQEPTEASGSGQCQEQTCNGGQQCAERRHGQGFQSALADCLQMSAAQVRAHEAQCVTAHLRQVVVTAQGEQVEAEVHKRCDHGRNHRQHDQQVARALHVNCLRSKRLSWSASSTSSRKVSSMLATSSPANMRIDRSIC